MTKRKSRIQAAQYTTNIGHTEIQILRLMMLEAGIRRLLAPLFLSYRVFAGLSHATPGDRDLPSLFFSEKT